MRGRVDDVTTGALRLLALPTDVAPMDNADCRAAVAAVVDRRAVQNALGGAGQRRPHARSCGRADCPAGREDRDPAPGPRRGPGAPDGVRPARRVLDRARRRRHAERASTLAERGRRRAGRGRHQGRGAAAGRRARSTPRTSASPDNVAANGYGIVLATWTADFPTAGLVPRAARRRAQHPLASATRTTPGSTTRRSTR